jgi:hypothetical protein
MRYNLSVIPSGATAVNAFARAVYTVGASLIRPGRRVA